MKVVKKSHPSYKAISRSQLRKEFSLGTGCLTINTTKGRYPQRESNRGIGECNSTDEDEDYAEDFTAKVALFPSKTFGKRKMLSLHHHQSNLMNGVVLTMPTVSLNQVRANNSEVFQLVTEGDLKGLQMSLQEGAASVRDHDEVGRSLLFVGVLKDPP